VFGLNTPAPNSWPKKDTLLTPNLHFLEEILNPAFRRAPMTYKVYSQHYAQLWANIITSSIYTAHITKLNECKIVVITNWNQPGAVLTPKGIR
jgi:hypothetical protein